MFSTRHEYFQARSKPNGNENDRNISQDLIQGHYTVDAVYFQLVSFETLYNSHKKSKQFRPQQC